jgi:hypothetical protein
LPEGWGAADSGPEASTVHGVECTADIVQHSHALKEADILKCAGHTQPGPLISAHTAYILAGKVNTAFGREYYSTKQIKDGGLASTIGTDKPDEVTSLDLQRIVAKSGKATKPFIQGLDGQ